MTSPSSARPPDSVVDTTALRHFAVTGQTRLLVEILGNQVWIPREILDPDESLGSDAQLLSEIGKAIKFLSGPRYGHADREDHITRLTALRADPALSIVDLDDDELDEAARLSSRTTQKQHDLGARLGPGEAAVMAVAMSRDWIAVIDDGAARHVLSQMSPETRVNTCQMLLRAAAGGILTSPEAQLVYNDLIDAGFKGPQSLWED